MPRDRRYDSTDASQDPRDPRTWTQVNSSPIDATGSKDVGGVRQIDGTKQSGYSFHYLADILFDSVIKDDGTGNASTNVTWTTAPPGRESAILVETSIDDGANWDECTSGGRVPKISVGAALGGRKLLCRQTFLDPAVALASLSVTINYENDVSGGAQQLSLIEDTDAEFALGTLRGVKVENNVAKTSTIAVRDFTGAGYIRIPETAKTRISDGVLVNYGSYGLQLQPFGLESERSLPIEQVAQNIYDRMSFAMQFLLTPKARVSTPPFSDEGGAVSQESRPDVEAGTILGWTGDGRDYHGATVAIVNRSTGPGGKKLFNGLEVSPGFGLTIKTAGPAGVGGDLFEPGRTYQIAVSYDGIIASIYVDGVAVAAKSILQSGNSLNSPTGPQVDPKGSPVVFIGADGSLYYDTGNTDAFRVFGTVFQTYGDLIVGRHPLSNSGFASCYLGELRLWSRPLPFSEISVKRFVTLSAAAATSLSAKGLVAYYRCDDIGASLTDSIGASNGYVDQAGPSSAVVPSPIGRSLLLNGSRRVYPYRISPASDLSRYGKALFVTTAPFNTSVNGHTYQGVGGLGDVRAISENQKSEATRVELSLSGVRTDFISTAFSAAYKDRPVTIYLVAFDANGQLLGAPVTLFVGRIDSMPISVAETATITLIAESELVSWERQHTLRYNDACQQLLYPRDKGMEFVAAMAEKDVWWPDRFTQEQTPA